MDSTINYTVQSNSLQSDTHRLAVSFLGIRRGFGLIGMMLPIVLGPIGYLCFGIEIQDNMSSYYHTPLRDVFVGILCAMGVFLYCYQGYNGFENWTGNVAGAAAFGVALFPLEKNVDPLFQSSVSGLVHTVSGGVFFLCLAIYSLFHFPIRNRSSKPKERSDHVISNIALYSSGLVLVFLMVCMGLYLMTYGSWKSYFNDLNLLFWMEWLAVWAFSSAWLVKGKLLAFVLLPYISRGE